MAQDFLMHLGSLNYRLIRMQTYPSLSSLLGSILFFLSILSVLTSRVRRNFGISKGGGGGV